METQAAQRRCHGEADLDEVVEVGLVAQIAERTEQVPMQLSQRGEALHGGTTLRTEQMPLQVEDSGSCGVEEELDRLVRHHALLASERERIDAYERHVVRGVQQGLELGDQPRAPGARLLECGKLPVEERLVDP